MSSILKLMKDISRKQISLRTSKAIGFVKINPTTFDWLQSGEPPVNQFFIEAIAAGKLAAKETYRLIPQCHHTSLDELQIKLELKNNEADHPFLDSEKDDFGVIIYAEGKSLGKVSIDMEVMTAVSVAALCICESIKSYDPGIQISLVRMLSKTGGKTEREKFFRRSFKVAILVCSNEASAGTRTDVAGQVAKEILEKFHASVVDYQIITEEYEAIQKQILEWVKTDVHFIFTLGGTGLGRKNIAVDAIAKILERDTPGIIEAMRDYGINRSPLAMMSRLIAGIISETIVVTLPGSTTGARESLEAILPGVFHARKMLKGGKN